MVQVSQLIKVNDRISWMRVWDWPWPNWALDYGTKECKFVLCLLTKRIFDGRMCGSEVNTTGVTG